MKTVDSAMMLRQSIAQREYDIIIINSPLKDENGFSLALDQAVKSTSSVLLLSPPAFYGEMEEKGRKAGLYVVRKPLSLPLLESAVSWLFSSSVRIRRLKQEKVRVEEKMNEIKCVNRAKWMLIEKEGLGEEEAQNYILKAAMDEGITKKKAAESIISRYSGTDQ